jgi:hypothetical protein
MISVNLQTSNKEDWLIQFSAIDEDTGDDIVFTGATIDFKLRDENGCTRLEASTGAGSITLAIPTVVEIAFTDEQMKTLCAGSYPFGCVYELNSVTAQLFSGSVSIYDGVASI